MELYSKVKLVRKDASCVYDTPGALAYHEAFVVLLGATKTNRYADVYLKNHGLTRKIRMNFNKDEQRYVYYDNDNNTKLYYHKTVSKEYSNKAWVNKHECMGIQYDVDRYAKANDIKDFFCVFKHSLDEDKYTFTSLVEDSKFNESIKDLPDDVKQKLNEQYFNRIKTAMYTYAKLGGYTSISAFTLFDIIKKGYTPYMMSQLLPTVTEDMVKDFKVIQEFKQQMIDQKNYEKAAEIRDTERKYIFNVLVNYANSVHI